MDQKMIEIMAQQLGVQLHQVNNTLELLDEGATVPFISRYRKERTGSLDEIQVLYIKEQGEKFKALENRKKTILNTIEELEQLTPDLKSRIEHCYDAVELEDIYSPYKPKRRTKATIARERGLEPLAKLIMKQHEADVQVLAARFLNDPVKTAEEALAGARDIISEWISENEKARIIVRREFERGAVISSRVVKGKEEEAAKYRDYFQWEEPLKKCPSHRLLAMRRGETEGFLRVSVKPNETLPLEHLTRFFVLRTNPCADQVRLAVVDSYKRLIEPSIENEFANLSKEKADQEAIAVFAENLRQLLLAPPLGQQRILAIDPGYRTGCKVVCLDQQGGLMHNDTIYPNKPQEDKKMAAKKLTSMVEMYRIDAIAIGNGTASRETEAFINKLHF
ncbi:MAG: Tex-like N-terminal domain-containing protein, partial [Mariniphaga sp.]|nr:Tex-like N-terminal domain-containing protein [Mariniphaga sp.]